MKLLTLLLALTVYSGVSAHGAHHHHHHGKPDEHQSTDSPHGHSSCRTKSPPLEDMMLIQKRVNKFKQKRNLGMDCKGCIQIPTYFHIFKPDNSQSEMSPSTVVKQLEVLNEGFKDTPFVFALRDSQYIVNARYYNNMDEGNREEEVSKSYRKGGVDTLNVYFGNKNEGGSWAYFPSQRPEGDTEPIVYDGVWEDIGTIPGGDEGCCGLGKTLIHEGMFRYILLAMNCTPFPMLTLFLLLATSYNSWPLVGPRSYIRW
jgi:hypothetical protein